MSFIVKLAQRLDRQEEREAMKEFYENGNMKARELLIERNLRLVGMVCERHRPNGRISEDELFSAGIVGLIRGIDLFDVSKGYRLSSFLTVCINNSIIREYNKSNKGPQLLSLDYEYEDDEDTAYRMEDMIEDRSVPIPDDNLMKNEFVEKLVLFVKNSVKPRNAEVFFSYYGLNGHKKLTTTEISKHYGIHQQRVSAVIKYVLVKIQDRFNSDLYI